MLTEDTHPPIIDNKTFALAGTLLAVRSSNPTKAAGVASDYQLTGKIICPRCGKAYWAHQGPPKVAQKHKVLADTLKLTWIATKIKPRPRLFLCLGDPLAARPFLPTSKSWAAHALQDLGVTVAVVDLPLEVQEKVRAAQRRQYR